jgi:hypothetical protein
VLDAVLVVDLLRPREQAVETCRSDYGVSPVRPVGAGLADVTVRGAGPMAGLNHEHPGGILFRTQAVAFCVVPRWGTARRDGGRYMVL